MPSSSTPEPPSDEAARLALEEVEEAEAILEQHPPKAEKALGEARTGGRGGGLITAGWALPGFAWLGFYLLAPLTLIILVSFWTPASNSYGFVKSWTFSNYTGLFHDSTYWNNMLSSFETSLIAVAACLLLGFPVAYFLALKVEKLQNQIALFIVALAPFWTSFLTRAIAWTFPLMGREGALNQLLLKLHIVSQPVDALGFSTLSVRMAMVQLYILFMITPLFFTLAQVDRTALEAARDLGGNWFRTFREVVLPQTMPGIVIGSIFIFVLTMGDYGTVQVIGGGNITSVGTIVNSKIGAVEYPQGAASAVLLVAALMLGVFVITRFSNLREDLVIETMAAAAEAVERPQDRVVRRTVKHRRDWAKLGLGTYFVVFLLFLYLPMVLMAILSFQGSNGQLSFPFIGPFSLGWWQSLWDSSLIGFGQSADLIRATAEQSLWLSLAAGGIVAALGFSLSMAFRRRWRFKTDSVAFYLIMLALMTPGFLVGLGNQLLWHAMNRTPSLWQTALGANVIWGVPFAFLVMLAVWNRYDKRVEEAARDLGADQKRTFREVTLPLIWTGIFGSFLFGFTLTWNDYDRTILLQNGYETQTLPLQIGGMTFSGAIRPDLYALGAATTAVSLLGIGLLLLVVWLRLRFRSAPVHRVAEEFGDTVGLEKAGRLGKRGK